MRSYELVYIIDPKVEEEEAQTSVIGKFEKVVADGGGEVLKVDRWGKRKLAYELGGNTEGFYVVMQFRVEKDTARELERVLKLTDEVLRHQLVLVDKHPA
ncbi:MAG: 30S ribosomal protein S6 [Firmicutes bacterium]|nr:30S ribosomal protein S6 [Bacillota bacterium]